MTPAARLIWVRTYERTGDAGLTCRRCGVSRPTLRNWWRRYQAEGLNGLTDRSRRPLRSPGKRVHDAEEQRILTLRRSRRLGIKAPAQRASPPARSEVQRRHHPQGARSARPEPAEKATDDPQGHETLQPTGSGGSGPDGCLQDRARALSIHGNRRLFPVSGGWFVSAPERSIHLGLSGPGERRNAFLNSTHTDRQRPGVLCIQSPGSAAGLVHQIPADSTALTASERQGGAGAKDVPGGVLADCRH